MIVSYLFYGCQHSVCFIAARGGNSEYLRKQKKKGNATVTVKNTGVYANQKNRFAKTNGAVYSKRVTIL